MHNFDHTHQNFKSVGVATPTSKLGPGRQRPSCRPQAHNPEGAVRSPRVDLLLLRGWLENNAEDGRVLRVVAMRARRPGEERWYFETRVPHLNIDHTDAHDIRNFP